MSQFTVYYIVKDWVEVVVSTDSEEEAKKIALKRVDSSGYKDKTIDIVDGNTEYAGIVLTDVTNQVNN